MPDETLVRMPKLADTLVEGTLGRWLKQVGEQVSQGEPLASIETDKVTTELTSPTDGTLLELLVTDGLTVPVDTPIARIGSAIAAGPGPRKATPLAARILAEHGLNVEQIPASASRITRDDVLAVVNARRRDAEGVAPLTSMRRAIAEHMTRARRTIPHGETVMDADLTELVAWRAAHKVTFTVLFVDALARQMAAEGIRPVDIGVAVALDAGLIVPVIRRVDELTLEGIAEHLADLASRARANALTPDELQRARMTLTNVGSFGNLSAAPIIPIGQIGILGPGLVERRPMPSREGGIRPASVCRLTLMFDRRELDEYAADRFLGGIVSHLTSTPLAR